MTMSADATTPNLRALLEEERDSLRAQLGELGFGAEGLNYDSNFADSSQVTAERGEAEALAKTLLDTLSEVEHALAKLSDSSYGQCESCGKPIGPARLEAKPAARYCIDCASKR
ncbi:MAG TPA: TraR/DksA C4-type zinc finger protein [Acidimicrobiales bacterium]|nr:TraR/DksA C4-type zinc finger protein [Acidimicrobiales bacterium]